MLVELRDVTKRYGSTVALRSASMTLAAGEILALLGENGAGKSTLAGILTGHVRPDAGDITMDGQTRRFASPKDALQAGVALVPQELSYVPDLTVAENLCLGRLPGRRGLTSPARVLRRARGYCDALGMDLPLERPMSRISPAVQQQVEIAKGLSRNAKVIVLDEPTAALSSHEAQALLELMRRVARSGIAIVYISHRLDEVVQVCRRAVVLRDGRVVATTDLADTRPDDLVRHMLGQAVETTVDRTVPPSVPEALSINAWTSRGQPGLNGVDLDIRHGEVLSLYGLLGSGSEAIAQGLVGLRRDITGSITLDGRTRSPFRSPASARRAGVLSVPPDRKSQGLVPAATVQDSVTLVVQGRLAVLHALRNRGRERAVAASLLKRLRVKAAAPSQPVSQLSGGNQQKVLIASRLAATPKVLVLNEPTRGVDVGARVEIHRSIRALAADGVAVVIATSDIDEAVVVSDRLAVIRRGRLVCELASPDQSAGARALSIAGGVE